MVPVCDKRYHIYNRFRHFWAEIKKLWNYPKTQCCAFTLWNWRVTLHSHRVKISKIVTKGLVILS